MTALMTSVFAAVCTVDGQFEFTFGQCPQAGMGKYIRTSALTCHMEVP